ncbi:helix-turn-helix domain-containing protein [Anthocerotibacter panamensis]|uniref:helix-turn-helix domain-containing protein n=1 Tax=Anthocerotibacter panamensis TaxID=2857077 RepID=UPI001C40397B|nr:tetratricopeptide repeat protein [Anthocerotibacter panamensis]
MAKLRLVWEDCSPLGQYVFNFMTAQQLSLNQVAARCGISIKGLKNNMLPGANPESKTLERIANGLGVPVNMLYQIWLQGQKVPQLQLETKEASAPKQSAQATLNVTDSVVAPFDLQLNPDEAKILIHDLLDRGKALLDLHQFEPARLELLQAFELAQDRDMLLEQCRALHYLGNCAYYLCTHIDGLDHSFQYYQRMLKLTEALGRKNLKQAREQKAAALANLGSVFLRQVNFEAAVDAYDRAIILAQEDFPLCKWLALFGKGGIALTRCHWQTAIEAYQLANTTLQVSTAKALPLWNNLAYALTKNGNYDEAEAWLLRVLRMARKDDLENRSIALYKLGYNEECRGRVKAAYHYYQQALGVKEVPEARVGMAWLTAPSDPKLGQYMALHGLSLLLERAATPHWDLTEEWIKLLKLLGQAALEGAQSWIAFINRVFPMQETFWEPQERRLLLGTVEEVIRTRDSVVH